MTSEELKELVSASSIKDVRFFKIEAAFDVDELREESDDEVDGEAVQFGVSMATRGDGAGLIATMTCEVQRLGIRYFLEVAGLYDVDFWEEDRFSSETIEGFGTQVAMYQLLPFAREGIADLATRLRLPVPILPLMPQDMGPGKLVDEDEDSATEAGDDTSD